MWFFNAEQERTTCKPCKPLLRSIDHASDMSTVDGSEHDFDTGLVEQLIPIESITCYQQDPFHTLLTCEGCKNPQPEVRYGCQFRHPWAAELRCIKCQRQWYVCLHCPARDLKRVLQTPSDLQKHDKHKRHKKAMKQYEKDRQEALERDKLELQEARDAFLRQQHLKRNQRRVRFTLPDDDVI